MDNLIDVLMQIIGYIPPQLMVVGIISYLTWFHTIHKKEHAAIIDRLTIAEESNTARTDEMSAMYKLVLRSNIVNPNIPKSARLDMYDDYKKHGYNSWVDQYVEENLLNAAEPRNRRIDDKEYNRQE